MPLVGTKEMFAKAYEGGYAIGAFNVNNMEIIQGITEAAKELNCKGAKYTKSHQAKKLEALWRCKDKSLACKLEYQIKHLNKTQKENIINGERISFYLKGKIDLPERDDDLLFSSISYIIECCPEFFSNKNAYDLAYYELDELSASSGIFDISTKILASKQKKKLKSINKKEEN